MEWVAPILFAVLLIFPAGNMEQFSDGATAGLFFRLSSEKPPEKYSTRKMQRILGPLAKNAKKMLASARSASASCWALLWTFLEQNSDWNMNSPKYWTSPQLGEHAATKEGPDRLQRTKSNPPSVFFELQKKNNWTYPHFGWLGCAFQTGKKESKSQHDGLYRDNFSQTSPQSSTPRNEFQPEKNKQKQ